MKSEKRMVGNYTVLCAVNIGSREIILAENEQDKNGERFLCCYGERNDIFQRYSECAVGDDYIDAALFFAERIKRDAELFRSEVEKLDIPVTVIAEADCIPDHYKNDINGKVIAINPAVLKPEYRRADRQLYLVTGGFGASANSRGSAVFCTNLYDGKPTRYEPVFLYLMAQKDIVSKRTETNRLKSSIESGKRRIQDLDKLIERIYEDQVLGNISAERYARMSINYENEQRELVKRVDEDEKRLVSIEQTSLDLKTLLKVLRSSTAFEELTPTLVNSLIRRIEVHNNDKSSGHCSVKVDIYFTAIGLIDIPTEDEIKSLMEKIQSNPQEYRLTA